MAKKVDWSKAPKLNTKERGDFYKKNNLKMDATTKVGGNVDMGGFTRPTTKKPKGPIAPKLNEIKPSSTYVDRINVSQAKKASDNNEIDLYQDARNGMSKTKLRIQQLGYDQEKRENEEQKTDKMSLSERKKYKLDKTNKSIDSFKSNNPQGPYGNSKGPSKALTGDQDQLPQHLQESILSAPSMVDNNAPGMYNKSKSKVEQDYARNAIHDFKSGKKSEGNYEKKKELEVAAGEGYFHSGHKVSRHSKKNRS